MRVALTGGIASGKSTVAALFAELGVPVIDLDEVAREVVMPGSALLAQVIARFGPAVQLAGGALDRMALREIIFHDAAARRDLEALLHPAIQARTEELAAAAGGAYQIIVIPLLVESDDAKRYDRVLLVDCDERLQGLRLAQRDGSSATLVAAALGAQATRAARRGVASDVILNDGETESLRPRVEKLHEQYLQMACNR